ncbi:MAG: RNA methyltransferase, partial [Ignavibacteria bacterium]|nr:RNA methyltransferase [Ignavibacteria bacterium]
LGIPDLQVYRTLRRPVDHIDQGIFVADGEKVVRRLIASGLDVLSFLLTPEWDGTLRGTEPRYEQISADIYLGPKELLSEIVGYRMHQGIMAVAKVPPEPDRESIGSGERPFIVALDGLMNAENVGVVVRNCAGFGVDAILVGETSSSPYLRRAVRNSMGTVFRVPVCHSGNLADDLAVLKRRGIPVIGTDPEGSAPIGRVSWERGCCLILGSEESGLRQPVRDACDLFVSIPMENQTDSLNVSSASAVLLYEVARQRRSP